jgi:hypothetical protein
MRCGKYLIFALVHEMYWRRGAKVKGSGNSIINKIKSGTEEQDGLL